MRLAERGAVDVVRLLEPVQLHPDLVERLGAGHALADQTLRDGERVRLGLFLEPLFQFGFMKLLRLRLGGVALDAEAIELLDERRDAHLRSLDLVREGFDLRRGGFGGGRVR